MSLTPFLLFAVLTSVGVYFLALSFLRRRRITQRQYLWLSVAALVVFGVTCGWVGWELRKTVNR